MSGSGTNNFAAPDRLTVIAGDQPIGTDVNGHDVLPSFYFFQFLQRILSYLGQPTGNSGVTLSTLVAEALNTAEAAASQVTNIQQLALSIQAQQAQERAMSIVPAAPNPCLTQAQVFARQTFVGGRW
jgi:hypothetical protein